MKRFFQKSNPYLSDPDVQRMLEVKRGSKVAFEALMRHYYPRILNFIYRFVGHKSTAEDLAQEVFMRAYKNAAKYKPKSKFQTWIYTIARNVALNDLRSGSRFAYSLDAPAGDGDDHINKEMADINLIAPDEKIIQMEKADQIRAAISQLPENQKSALILRRYEEFSYAEIAVALGVSDKAVKSLLSRAMQNLKNRLADQIEPD